MKKLQDNLAARIAASVILTVSFLLTLLSTARSCVHPICMRQESRNTTTMSNRCWRDLSMSRRAIRIT